MTVKMNSKRLLVALVFAAILVHQIQSQRRCNVDIMNRYLLTGREQSISNQMKICPTVRESCCTVSDEVSIHVLWNSRSKPLLDRHRDRVIEHVYQTIHYFTDLMHFDPLLIMFKYRIPRNITITVPSCQTMIRQITKKDVEDVRDYFHWASQVDVPLKQPADPFFNRWISRNAMHLNWNVANYGFNYKRNNIAFVDTTTNAGVNPPHGSISGVVDPDLHNTRPNFHISSLMSTQKTPIQSVPLQDEPSWRKMKQDKNQQNNPLNMTLEKNQNNEFNSTLNQKPDSIQSQTSADKNNDNFSTSQNPRRLNLRRPQFNRKNYQNERYSHRKNNQFEQRKMTHEVWRKNRQYIGNQRNRQSYFHAQKERRLNDKSLKKHNNRKLNSQERRAQIIEESRRPSYIHTFQNQCRPIRLNFLKAFTIVNTRKSHFCLQIYRQFLNYDISLFENFVPTIRATITTIQNTKKGFYCGLCDGSAQTNIKTDTGLIIYSPKYCEDLIRNHMDYFKFMNIVFIRFANQMLQYVQCFESDAKVFAFPFRNFMINHMRRILFWGNCLKDISAKSPSDELENEGTPSCWNICNKISMTTISPLFEGDLILLDRITATLFSFIRKMNVETDVYNESAKSIRDLDYITENVFNVRADENVNGLLIEPLHPSDFLTNVFIPDRNSSQLFLGRDPTTGFTRKDYMQLAVNDLLRRVRLGNLKLLSEYGRTTLSFFQQPVMVNDKILVNEDKSKSIINGLVNQLYSLKSTHMLRRSDRPERFLKHAVMKIIKKTGINPGEYERMLHVYNWVSVGPAFDPKANKSDESDGAKPADSPNENNSTEVVLAYPGQILNNTVYGGNWVVNRSIIEVNHTNITTYGDHFENITEKEEKPFDPEFEEEGGNDATDEDIVAIYETIEHSPSIESYGYKSLIEGFNPTLYSNNSAFTYNISRLIGMTRYEIPDKLDTDVIGLFLANDAKHINLFNYQFKESVNNMTTLQGEFPEMINIERINLIKFFSKMLWNSREVILSDKYPSKNVTLLLDKMKRNFTTSGVNRHVNKTIMDRTNGKIFPENVDEEFDNHHFNGMSFYEKIVEVLSDLFVGLFGTETTKK